MNCSVTLTNITGRFAFHFHFLSLKSRFSTQHEELTAAADPVGTTNMQGCSKGIGAELNTNLHCD